MVCFLAPMLFALLPSAFALSLDDLDPAKEWRLAGLYFSGNTNFSINTEITILW